MLRVEEVAAVVERHVSEVRAIDVHTHLLPPSHGNLLLYGIDQLLTYHYLVAELFMLLPLPTDDDSVSVGGEAAPSPDTFFAWPKERQAELVFDQLFVRRTPLSEAARGVVTTLRALGLRDMLRDATRRPADAVGGRLAELRGWFAAHDPTDHLRRCFDLTGLRYAVMTNIPFSAEEARHWLRPADGIDACAALPDCLKPALRVDPLLAGNWPAVRAAISGCEPPYPPTLAGVRAFVDDWVARMRPVYLMASTPAGFTYAPLPAGAPEAAADAQPSGADLLERVLLAAAREHSLPIALKVGAVRGANPALREGGDGVEVADLSFVWRLCAAHRDVKFLLTVLSVDNQHELCVLARKFGNLHVYGCWWFCNNPSIIDSVTRMRLEMLGTAFTAQHSDARVLEQVVYKWAHSRAAITPVLAEAYTRLVRAGWELTEDDVARDVGLLFGGAYEVFMAK